MEEDKDYINLIHGDLTRATQIQNGLPDSIGVMSIKTANWTILEASLLPTPRALWNSFGYEGELSCVFADSNVGKSILAVQIADRIARTDNVLYLDLELSEKQFQLRYTGEHGKLYTFPDRLYRVSLDSNSLLEDNFEDWNMHALRERVKLVQELDQLADRMVELALRLTREAQVIEEEYFLPQTRKVLVTTL